MKNVILNEYGECVVSQENTNGMLSYGLKLHAFCGEFVDLGKVSKTHQAFHCRRCNFRFVFPIKIDTWLKLKQFVKGDKK